MQLSALAKGLLTLAGDNLTLPNKTPLSVAGPYLKFRVGQLSTQLPQALQRPAVRATTSGLLATTVAMAPTPPAQALTLSPGFGQVPPPKAGYFLPESLSDCPLGAVVDGADDPVAATAKLAAANENLLTGQALPVVWSSEGTDLFTSPAALKTLAEEGHVGTVLTDAWAVGDEPLIKAFLAAGLDPKALKQAEAALRQRLTPEGFSGAELKAYQDTQLALLKAAAQQPGLSVHGLKPTPAPEDPDVGLRQMHNTVTDWMDAHPGQHPLVLVDGKLAPRLAQLDPTAPWPSLAVQKEPLVPFLSSQLLRQAPNLPSDLPRADFVAYRP